jgi:adhesin/invasin
MQPDALTPDFTELHSGNLSGQTLVPGLYKWGTGVLATSNFTISGGANDVWIFQIAGNLTLQSNVNVILAGGAQASNIFWQVAGEANIGTNSHFEGVILSQTAIHLFTGASINGRMLAQSAVTMDQNNVAQPVVAAEPSLALTTIVGNPTFLVANGLTTSTITVTLFDAAGDPVGASGGTVALSATTGTLGSVTDNGDGTYTATYTSPTSTSGTPAVISGTLNGDTILDTAFIALNAGPPSGANSTLVANPNTLPANGTSTSIVTATIYDANGNLTSGGANVVLSTNLGTLSSVTDNGNGTYTAVFTASVTTGTATISGTVNGQNLPTATVVMGAGIASTATTTIDASPTSIVANGISTSTITVRLRDAEGNLLTTGGATIVLAASTGTIGVVTDNNNGTYTATYTSPVLTSGSPAVISGTLNGSAILDTAQIALISGPANGANSTMTASPNTIPANGTSTSTITVTLRDVNGNLVLSGGNTVLLNTNLGSLGSVTNNGNGTYTAILTSSVTTGTATINGTVNGQNLPSATVVMGSGVASTQTTTIDANPTILIANGISTSTITVRLRDALGNLITSGASTVTLSASVGTLGSVTNHGNGTYTAVYSSPIFTAGSPAIISGTLNGNLIDDTAQITLVAGPVHGPSSTMVASPNTLPANGTSTSTVTVTLRDVNGNLITGGGAIVAISY